MDQARLTTDGIHFDSVEGQAWLNRVFQERLDELEAELFDTGVLKEEGTVSDTVITTFVPPNLETRLGTVPAVTNYRQQSSSEPGRRTDVQDRLGEAPMRRTIHPRRRIGPVNQPIEEVAGTSRSETRSETTSTSREERPSRGSLMWSLIHTVSLAYIQRRTNEAGPTESELHRRCKEDAEWSDAIRQQIVLDNRRRLVDSR